MPPPSAFSLAGPITWLPSDIILEIFSHCLLRYPLHRRQPSTTTAPLLLCRICSSWRTLALGTPSLWTHLSFCLTVVQEDTDAVLGAPSWTVDFIEREIAFLEWWTKHHRRLAPSLSFDVDKIHYTQTDETISSNDVAFLVDYFTSAQYLELDKFGWDLIHLQTQYDHPIRFRKLHTLLVDHTWAESRSFYKLQTRLPAHAFPALRRLAISDATPPNDFTIPRHWAALTHLSLRTTLSLPFFRALIRAVPRLVWGYFDIATSAPPSSTPLPSECTLGTLTTLTIAIRGRLEPHQIFPLRFLFAHLHLPALHTLALSAPGAKPWEDVRALHELYAVLNSTPALTKLVLEDNTLALTTTTTTTPPPIVPTPITDPVEPIWHHAPALTHLQLGLPSHIATRTAAREAHLAHFAATVFAPARGWLDLHNPACPIRTITISNSGEGTRMSEAAMAGIREQAGGVPGVVVEISSESAGRVAAEVRKEWGSRM